MRTHLYVLYFAKSVPGRKLYLISCALAATQPSSKTRPTANIRKVRFITNTFLSEIPTPGLKRFYGPTTAVRNCHFLQANNRARRQMSTSLLYQLTAAG